MEPTSDCFTYETRDSSNPSNDSIFLSDLLYPDSAENKQTKRLFLFRVILSPVEEIYSEVLFDLV